MPLSVFCGAVREACDPRLRRQGVGSDSYTHAPCIRLVITSFSKN